MWSANERKVMTNSTQRPVKVFGQQIDYIQEYVYLGKQVSFNKNSNKEEVNRRINSTWKNEDIRRKTRLTDALEQALRLKWKWAGHLSRYADKRWSLQTTKWVGPAGKRSKGRPLKRWADNIKELAAKDWLTLSQNRDKWKELEEAFTRKGTPSGSLLHPPKTWCFVVTESRLKLDFGESARYRVAFVKF
ncbi:Putative uncharacterized transposon-derived protein F52C9.6 [Eumeta japonica]|uniref:Uncharacterized transposon-derived protein F52C9.6 n=1 Tax=Eumeta variegata TaxID=151549 RepID=A0A4C1SX12_EUMVA|nr:Putative uncharacterized transposon-derived protein F52C9.6 [Eumeta japonica]